MRAPSWRYASELRQVFHLSELRAPYDGVDIVVVPGLWVPYSPEKVSEECSWLKLLVASTDNDTRVFIFKYEIEPNETGSVWHQLLGLSKVLLDNLRQIRPFESQKRPLYFISHSLGGVLLKQALYLARRDYAAIYNALSGIIFLGTPHLTSADDERWERWRLILKLFRKDVPKTAVSRQDAEMLVKVFERFNGLNLRISVISVYETKETKMKDKGPIDRIRGVGKMLVDRSHATIKMENEELIGADASHGELQFVNPSTPLFQRLVEYLKKAPPNGLDIVTSAYQRMEICLDLSDTDSWLGGNPGTAEQETGELQGGGVVKSAQERLHVLLPCHTLGQSRNRNFFGQEEYLDFLDQTLSPAAYTDSELRNDGETTMGGSTTLKAFAICGMGGLGKSEIAVEYIHTRKAKYDAIFWVNSASIQKLDAGFRDIALKLGLRSEEQVLTEFPEVSREIVKAWLKNPLRVIAADKPEQHSDVNWLIVFDNADDPEILLPFWPQESKGSVLITSRNPLAKEGQFAEVQGVDLPPMSFSIAGRLLQKISLREAESMSLETCTTIAGRLGGLPLAIAQMGYLIGIKHLSLVEFLEYYDLDTKKFQETLVPGLTKQQTVASIWNVESLPSPAVALLRVLSVLDADAIYEDILTKGATNVELESYPQDKPSYFEAREALIKSSLVTRNMDLGFLKIHRLVQDVVRQKLSIEELRGVYSAAVTLVSAVWPFVDGSNLNRADRLHKLQRFSPHVSMFRSIVVEKTPKALKPNIEVSRLFNEASWTYILQSWGYNLRDGVEFASLSQKVLEVGDDKGDYRISSKLLADSYRYQGITATYMGTDLAVPSCRRWISLLVERIEKYQDPADTKTMPIAYNELGMALMRVPDQDEALRAWVMSCETLPQVTKKGDLPFPFPWVHRALVASYSGHPGQGHDILEPILRERENKLGSDDTKTIETGFILSFMGNIYRLQGKYDKGFSFHKRGASCLKITTGERSAFATQAFYRLARDHFDREEYEDAVKLLEKCVSFAGNIPWYKPEAARSAWKLGRTFLGVGGDDNLDKAQTLLERAMHLRHELVPEDDRNEEDLTDADWDKLVYYFSR